jgi:hypothetical protein
LTIHSSPQITLVHLAADTIPLVGAALEIFPLENQKKSFWVPHTQKNRNKKNKQANPTEQLRTTPKLLIFDFNDGNQNARQGPYYAMLPSCSPGFSHVVAGLHCLCVGLRR